MRFAAKIKQALPAMDARETVSRYCLDCSSNVSKMVLHGCVASVCHVGRPFSTHWGTMDFPPGRAEFQHSRFASMGTLFCVAHRSDRVPLLSRLNP